MSNNFETKQNSAPNPGQAPDAVGDLTCIGAQLLDRFQRRPEIFVLNEEAFRCCKMLFISANVTKQMLKRTVKGRWRVDTSA